MEELDTDTESQEMKLETPPLAEIPEDVYNLVPHFLAEREEESGKSFLKKVSCQVLDEFKEDRDSMAQWLEKRAERNKLIWGDIEEKTFPWDGCANLHLPVMLERILRVVHRIYGEIFQPNEPFAVALPSPSRNKDESDVLTLHMQHQFMKDMIDFGKQNRRALFEMVAHGDCVFFSYRDRVKGVNRHVHLSADEIAFPYKWKSDTLDMSDVPRISRIIRKTKNELLELQDSGDYCCVDKVIEKAEPSFDDGLDTPVKDQADAMEGRDRFETKTVCTYTIVEQHTWLKLPGATRERPVIVTVEKATGYVLCISLREADDARDRSRFNREMAEYQDYVNRVSAFTQAKTMELEVDQRLASGDIPPQEEMALREAVVNEPLPEPSKPIWMKTGMDGAPQEPDPVKTVPINMFSHQVCIENPDGSLGIGLGTMLEQPNVAVDTMLNQYIDAATVANSNTLIVSKDIIPPGVQSVSPNQVIRVDKFLHGNIADQIYELKPKGGNEQLLRGVELLMQGADGVSSAPDAMSGEREGPETYRGFAGRIEQATKQLTIFAMNYIELLGQIIRNNAVLNYQFMADEELIAVIDPRTTSVQGIRVGRAMYENTFDVVFTADVRFASKAQKIAEWDDVLGMLTKGIPPEIASKVMHLQIFAEVARGALKARGMHALLQYIRSDEEIEQALQQPVMPPGMPGQPPGGMQQPGQPGGAPPPSIPTGAPNQAPGEGGGRTRPPEGSPVESGAGV